MIMKIRFATKRTSRILHEMWCRKDRPHTSATRIVPGELNWPETDTQNGGHLVMLRLESKSSIPSSRQVLNYKFFLGPFVVFRFQPSQLKLKWQEPGPHTRITVTDKVWNQRLKTSPSANPFLVSTFWPVFGSCKSLWVLSFLIWFLLCSTFCDPTQAPNCQTSGSDRFSESLQLKEHVTNLDGETLGLSTLHIFKVAHNKLEKLFPGLCTMFKIPADLT